MDKVIEVVEEHVAEAPPENDTKKGHQGDEVRHLVGANLGQVPLRQPEHDAVGQVETQDVGESVPMEGDGIADLEQVRAEIVQVIGGGWERHGGRKEVQPGALSGKSNL